MRLKNTTSNCGRNMYIKPAIDNGPGRQCWTTFRGETLKWTWKAGSYGRIAAS